MTKLMNKYYDEECDLTQFSNYELSMFENEITNIYNEIVKLQAIRTLFATYQG
jgi:hypothetical protein